MSDARRHYVFLGLSITSTWGNGHATTYRGLLKELAARGHRVTFLERNVPWYEENREFSNLPYCQIHLYERLEQLREEFGETVRQADAVVIGSYVPEGIAVGRWVLESSPSLVVFYDIDTPVTLASLARGECTYLAGDLVSKYDLYLSFTGGPTLRLVENRYQSPYARPLYCSVDPALYFLEPQEKTWSLGYLGTYAADRQPTLEAFLLDPARRRPNEHFVVAGPQYPEEIEWPGNVTHFEHLPACDHRKFYNSQKFALNVTRMDMVRAGYSPSVRLFEAAACGVPIISDEWAGLDSFFQPHTEIIPARHPDDVLGALEMTPDQRTAIAERARRRVLQFHTAKVRAAEFDAFVIESLNRKSRSNKSRVQTSKKPFAVALQRSK